VDEVVGHLDLADSPAVDFHVADFRAAASHSRAADAAQVATAVVAVATAAAAEIIDSMAPLAVTMVSHRQLLLQCFGGCDHPVVVLIVPHELRRRAIVPRAAVLVHRHLAVAVGVARFEPAG
jgi:hypothetical protein